jgi:hypothetical protein
VTTTPPPDPGYDEVDRAAVRRHNVELLTKLNDAAAAWALKLLEPPKPQDPETAEKIGVTFDRALRGVRRTILLIDRLIAPPKAPAADPRPRRPPEPPRRRRTGTPEAERAIDRLDRLDRLDTTDYWDPEVNLDNVPDDELFYKLCQLIGLDLIDDNGNLRGPAKIKAICYLRQSTYYRNKAAAAAEPDPPPDTS